MSVPPPCPENPCPIIVWSRRIRAGGIWGRVQGVGPAIEVAWYGVESIDRCAAITLIVYLSNIVIKGFVHVQCFQF